MPDFTLSLFQTLHARDLEAEFECSFIDPSYLVDLLENDFRPLRVNEGPYN
jgi:hypothetical protein